MKVDFYYVDDQYVNFLKQAELRERNFTCVPNVSYANRDKFLYGAVFSIHGINYFVPVSSKLCKNPEYNLTIVAPKDKTNKSKGTLRFPYMIPVPNACLRRLDIKKMPTEAERITVSKELAFCRRHKDKIIAYAEKTYEAVITKANEKLVKNSCDFPLLEQAYILFCKERGIQIPHELQEAHPEMYQDCAHGEPQQAAARTAHTISRAKRSDITAQAQRAGHTDKAQQRGAQAHSHDDELS